MSYTICTVADKFNSQANMQEKLSTFYRRISFIMTFFRSGLGNHYGTLSGPIGAFSPVSKPGKAYKGSGKNFYTNPGKHGTGFG